MSAIAIGGNAYHRQSVAIGNKAETTAEQQIVLGGANDTVYIPGNLVVNQSAIFNAGNSEARTILRRANGGLEMCTLRSEDLKGGDDNLRKIFTDIPSSVQPLYTSYYSDRRLKNVGEKFTSGLEKIKKLDVYNYTFKKDETKTPHVGVIAQDLKKIFPDAVTKGEDGYLRIRFEDMFYALVNAVKELDSKITEVVNNITQINSTDEKQNQTIAEQQKIIEQLRNNNAEQQKLIENLEKRIEKLEKSK